MQFNLIKTCKEQCSMAPVMRDMAVVGQLLESDQAEMNRQ